MERHGNDTRVGSTPDDKYACEMTKPSNANSDFVKCGLTTGVKRDEPSKYLFEKTPKKVPADTPGINSLFAFEFDTKRIFFKQFGGEC